MRVLISAVLSAFCLFSTSCGGKTDVTPASDADDAPVFCDTIPDADYSVVITGDTVYFKILDDNKRVSLVDWHRSNFDNHILEIPSSVNLHGKEYEVVEVGDEAMGAGLNSGRELNSIWAGDDHGVERIILPPTVKRIGDAAFLIVSPSTMCFTTKTTNV